MDPPWCCATTQADDSWERRRSSSPAAIAVWGGGALGSWEVMYSWNETTSSRFVISRPGVIVVGRGCSWVVWNEALSRVEPVVDL